MTRFVVSTQSLVTSNRNRYSVQAEFAGQVVRLEIHSDHNYVCHKDVLAASHKRLEGCGGAATKLEHDREVIPYKRRAVLDDAFVGSMPQVYQMAREHRLQARLHLARFPSVKTLDASDFSAIPSLPKPNVLDLARGESIRR